jgi:alpha-L-arabinofuranosidase
VLTPTYHVFDLYQAHQGAQGLRLTIEAPALPVAHGGQRASLPGLTGSASVKNALLTLSFVNPHASLPLDVGVEIVGASPRVAQAAVLSHEDLAAHNTFDEPDNLRPREEEIAVPGDDWVYTCPPASVNVLRIPT